MRRDVSEFVRQLRIRITSPRTHRIMRRSDPPRSLEQRMAPVFERDTSAPRRRAPRRYSLGSPTSLIPPPLDARFRASPQVHPLGVECVALQVAPRKAVLDSRALLRAGRLLEASDKLGLRVCEAHDALKVGPDEPE